MTPARRRWALGAGVGLLALIGVTVIHPWVLVRSAMFALHEDPCAFGTHSGSETPPEPAYFVALDDLAYAATYPWFERAAADLTQAASMRCLGNFAVACQQVKAAAEDEAVAAARAAIDREMRVADHAEAAGRALQALRDEPMKAWREHLPRPVRAAFCTSWRPFIDQLEAARVDIAGPCPVCAPPPPDQSPK